LLGFFCSWVVPFCYLDPPPPLTPPRFRFFLFCFFLSCTPFGPFLCQHPPATLWARVFFWCLVFVLRFGFCGVWCCSFLFFGLWGLFFCFRVFCVCCFFVGFLGGLGCSCFFWGFFSFFFSFFLSFFFFVLRLTPPDRTRLQLLAARFIFFFLTVPTSLFMQPLFLRCELRDGLPLPPLHF